MRNKAHKLQQIATITPLSHKMAPIAKSKSNSKTNEALDKVLLQHCLSPYRNQSASYLAKTGQITPEQKRQAYNRLDYFIKLEKKDLNGFLELCNYHKLDASRITPRKVNFEESLKPIKIEKMPAGTWAGNELGEIITTYLDDGLLFVYVWIDSKLDENILKIEVKENGMGAVMKKKVPKPTDAEEALSMFDWAKDKKNYVVKAFDAQLHELKRDIDANNEWKPIDILVTSEEVIRSFVDIDGKPTNEIKFKADKDGRKTCAFFLKTLRSHESVPKAATFVNAASTYKSTTKNGVHVGVRMDLEVPNDAADDSSYSVSDSQVEEVRAEMDEKFDKISRENQDLKNELKNEISKLTTDFGTALRQIMENVQQPAGPVVPDPAVSY